MTLGFLLHGDINLALACFRIQRIQEEKEESERKQAEAVINRKLKEQEHIKAKEMEILQLQVRRNYPPGHVPEYRYRLNLCLTGWLFLQQEDAKNFITMENLDQRIEEALDNPKNYNFAIDKEGRVVKQTVLQWNDSWSFARGRSLVSIRTTPGVKPLL